MCIKPTAWKQKVAGLLSLMLLPAILFTGCDNGFNYDKLSPEEQAKWDEDREWLEKYFPFEFQGREEIELRFYDYSDVYAAKIHIQEKDLSKFLEKFDFKRMNSGQSYQHTLIILENFLLPGDEQLDNFLNFVYFDEGEFEYAWLGVSIAYIGEFKTTRSLLGVILAPKDGIVTVYVIANKVYAKSSLDEI